MTDYLVDKARKSVFEKIGRNVCNLQKVEGLMKFLVISSTAASGTVNEVRAKLRELEQSLTKKSMGMVAKDMFQSVFGAPENIEAPEESKEPWFSFRFSIESKKEAVKVLERALSNVIEERNNLIHHDVAKYDLETIEGCRRVADVLEIQSQRIKLMHLTLNGLAKSMVESRKAVAEHMGTDEFRAYFQGVESEENDATSPN